MQLKPTSWLTKGRALPGKLLIAAIAQLKKRYQLLKKRYGPRYTKAMLGVAFFALFSPIPGTTLVGVGALVVIAEIHRALYRKGGLAEAGAGEQAMSINCDVILQWSATPNQLMALGAALWPWCNRAAGNTGTYQYLDNQGLADLVAGKFPAAAQMSAPAEHPRVHFRLRDEAFPDRQATIASLRQEIPAEGVEDILVNGSSWNLVPLRNQPGLGLVRE